MGFGGIAGVVNINGSEVANATVHSAKFCSALGNRLKSAEFMSSLRATDLRRPTFFPEGTSVVARPWSLGLDAQVSAAELKTAVTDAVQGPTLLITMMETGEVNLSVMYLYFQSYRVEKPENSWVRWFQSWLPQMPDEAVLAAEAEAANEVVKRGVERAN